MRFRPLLIDYEAEAIQLHHEQEQIEGKKRSILWIKQPRQVHHCEKRLREEGKFTSGAFDHFGHGDSINDVESNQDKHSLLNNHKVSWTRNHVSTTITPTPAKKQRHQCENDEKEEENFTAVFHPPSAYTKLMDDDWSPVSNV
jgi:hypothetical protein